MKIWMLFVGCLYFGTLAAQNYVYPEPRNYDYVYQNNIKSVRLELNDSDTDYPIVQLGSPTKLILTFDDLNADGRNYTYKIVHCNAEWQPSEQLHYMEYVEGFEEEIIFDYYSSVNTMVDYNHYRLELPNQNMSWKLSGNYLLKVYQNDDERDLIITKRFMVVDPKMKAVLQQRGSAVPPYSDTHQEMTVRVEHAGLRLANPQQQVSVAVLQNGRWDNAITNLTPTFLRDESLVYDFQGSIIFPGGREFRALDLRSYRFRTEQVQNIIEEEDAFHVALFPSRPRVNLPYSFTNDINGHFIILNHDFEDEHLQSDYANVYFTLNIPQMGDSEIYLFSEFTDWQLKEQFKLSYLEDKGLYRHVLPLKNGFYNYYYAVKDEKGQPNILPIEGSSFQTENDYHVLVYYRPYGGRYDELVAVTKMNTGS